MLRRAIQSDSVNMQDDTSCLLISYIMPSLSVLSKPRQNQGFALVIALSLMAFVLMLLLSITTLVQVESTGAQMQMQRVEAQQAALLSLNLAIGKLQETAGLDQRVTAPAESVAGVTGPQQLTGVWRSWEGSDHQSNGLPIAPNYGSKLDDGELDIEAAPFEDGRFLGWLVSSAFDPTITTSMDANSPPDLAEVMGVTEPLVGKGSVGIGSDAAYALENEVHVKPTLIDDGEASIAWWISGENTKSLLNVPEDSSSIIDWKERFASSSRPDASVFQITDTNEMEKVSSRLSLNQIPNDVRLGEALSGKYFHDLTTHARGLLTNTATGGWRRDLSLMSEQWSDSGFSTKELPFFTLTPGVETAAGKASVNGASDAGNLIYPWSIESVFEVNGGAWKDTKNGAASVSWDALVDFAQQYRKVTTTDATGRASMPLEAINPRDAIPRRPVIARIHWLFSFMSRPDTSSPIDSDTGKYTSFRAYILASPVMTLWNPYNVAIAGFEDFTLRFQEPVIPVSFKFTVGSVTQSAFYGIDQFAGDNRLFFKMSADTSEWAPGESRVYSANSTVGANSNKVIHLELGYRTDGGARYALYQKYTGGRDPRMVGPLIGEADDVFQVAFKMEDDTAFKIEAYGQDTVTTDLLYSVPKATSDLYYEDLTLENDDETLGSVEESVEFPEPFLVSIMQLRNSTIRSTDSKGYFHAKPNLYNTSKNYDYLDAYPYDWVFFTPNGTNGSDALPQAGGANNSSGYVGTSFRPDVGLSRSVVYEIPTSPLRSMGELQHFDVNYYNPLPPYFANPIGNSHASFLIEPDAVAIVGTEADDVHTTYDHSYMANHLLFDDWFVSSISPEILAGTTSEERSIEQVYGDFISGQSALPNGAYLPAATVTVAEAASLAIDWMADTSAWHHVASEIEVDGMFNINSTSVEAWTALLGHMSRGAVPHIAQDPDPSVNAWSIVLENGSGHPVSRTTVAGDPSVNPDSVISQIGTHTRLTQEQIEELAAQIVEQVKLRGPFLSLSEFVNRRLTDADAGLSRAGAIEAALIELSELGASSKNPYFSLQNTFLNPDTGGVDNVDVVGSPAFPEAAEGNVSYGFPGWVRQADVLRPIAPVLSARDDTFIIRAYGESRDPVRGETRAHAWCEAVVQRRADYVDDISDEAIVLPSDGTLSSVVNKRFGRRFSIISFRWLSPDEV